MSIIDTDKIRIEWDTYWELDKKSSRRIYDVIASFYRIFLIRGSLNHFIIKHFNQGSNLLHAGCGSGQVDFKIRKIFNITALDISINALKKYKQYNGLNSQVVQGNIFSLPFDENSFDGIYNLGVMEHFSEIDILNIFREFKRVLKPNGKLIIFWPPTYGLSVMFFKALSFIMKNIFFRKNIKFHPTEITQLKSKNEAKRLLALENLKLVEFYFGLRDFYTYAVLVVSKDIV